ncbi:uncharacterized protein EI90DRAFT_3082794 [Cantharellus anzutake]|uniref:uncharacterized protein n=1 Tax=Cantharellus anzutake TaxID=1750568 RepID=UPI001902C526|nr:uncharacterized protein EI90DRAFT_3082794 [Cantharellus anzutake]KAF8318940.1 hypothetical protein EI90DRAFT_3082794 [Cantharellus anzutake]
MQPFLNRTLPLSNVTGINYSRRLPLVVLQYIFEVAWRGTSRVEGVEDAAPHHVETLTSLWRQAALSTPMIWSSVCYQHLVKANHGYNIMQLYLYTTRFTSHYPLSVDFTLPARQADPHIFELCTQLVAQHLDHIRTLRVKCDDDLSCVLGVISGCRAPLLRSLQIETREVQPEHAVPRQVVHHRVLSEAENLVDVVICARDRWDPSTFPRVRTLQWILVDADPPEYSAQFLASLPYLEHLALSDQCGSQVPEISGFQNPSITQADITSDDSIAIESLLTSLRHTNLGDLDFQPISSHFECTTALDAEFRVSADAGQYVHHASDFDSSRVVLVPEEVAFAGRLCDQLPFIEVMTIHVQVYPNFPNALLYTLATSTKCQHLKTIVLMGAPSVEQTTQAMEGWMGALISVAETRLNNRMKLETVSIVGDCMLTPPWGRMTQLLGYIDMFIIENERRVLEFVRDHPVRNWDLYKQLIEEDY